MCVVMCYVVTHSFRYCEVFVYVQIQTVRTLCARLLFVLVSVRMSVGFAL